MTWPRNPCATECLAFQPTCVNVCHACQLPSVFDLLLATILQKRAESLVTCGGAVSVCPGQAVMSSCVYFVTFSDHACSVQAPSGYVASPPVVRPPLGQGSLFRGLWLQTATLGLPAASLLWEGCWLQCCFWGLLCTPWQSGQPHAVTLACRSVLKRSAFEFVVAEKAASRNCSCPGTLFFFKLTLSNNTEAAVEARYQLHFV